MAGKTRSKAAGYHGVQNMKFAPKKSGTMIPRSWT